MARVKVAGDIDFTRGISRPQAAASACATIQERLHAENGIMIRRLLTITEVSQYTGLSVHTLYTMVSQRRIPYVKVGRLVKFDVALLDAWIKKRTVMPIASLHG